QYMESLFQDDDLKCSIYQFDNTIRLHFVHQDYRGYYVSFDYSQELDPSEIVKECTDMMSEYEDDGDTEGE
ncbi:MAG: hypothetical protein SXQ77_06200, partial [Halobacteria archaeon]|nr:hypothetical protein [Halobacteria archaeon]